MNTRIAARMTAVFALCAAMAAALMALRGDGLPDAPSQRQAYPGGEPYRLDLQRCRVLGTAALDDPRCRQVWAENRRRFLQPGKNVTAPFAQHKGPKTQDRLRPAERVTSEDRPDFGDR